MKSSPKFTDTEESELSETTCTLLKKEIMVPREAPLYRRMSIALEELISQGVLRPGEQLPSERNLTRQLGLSRRTVRAALGNLIENKHLVPVHGKGNFIRRERHPVVDVVIPEPFLPDYWGNRPSHYEWIRDAAKKTHCAEKYMFSPDLESLDRVLMARTNRQEGILIFRPSHEWLNHLCALERTAKVSRMQPIMVINRETEGTGLNSTTDNHKEAVTQSVAKLAASGAGEIGLITAKVEEFTFAVQQKDGFVRAMAERHLRVNDRNHLEIPLKAVQDGKLSKTIAEFLTARKLEAVVVAGSAFEKAFISAQEYLAPEFRKKLKAVLFTESEDRKGHPAGSICYIEPTVKVLCEGLIALREILEGSAEQPVHRRVMGDFIDTASKNAKS